MPSTTDQRPFYRRKRTWILMAVATPLVTVAAVILTGRQQMNRQLTKLQQAGLPTNGEELNDFYAVPEGVDDTTSLWIAAIQSVSGNRFQQSVDGLPFLGQATEPVVGDEWPELNAAREFIASNSDSMQAGGAVRFPVDFRNGINTLLAYTNDARTIARLLTLDAHVSQRDGNHQQVVLDISGIFSLADSLQREPSFISQLVRIADYSIACDTTQKLLPACEWSDDQLATLQSAAAKMNSRDAIVLALNGERAIGLLAIDTMPSMVGMRASHKSEILRLYRLLAVTLEKPWHEALKEQKSISADFAVNRGLIGNLRFEMVRMLVPAYEQITQAGARNSPRQLCTIAALAAQRYRLVHGDFPDSLGQITSDVLPAEFDSTDWLDPFTGEPVSFVVTESGLTVYSVGPDLVDNEGDVLPGENGQSTDVGFFLKR